LSQRPVAIANLHPGLRVDRRAVARAVRTLDRHHAALSHAGSVLAGTGELSVVFMTDQALAGLHYDFLADPAPTDVITFSFPGAPAAGIAGEICISADAALRQAASGRGKVAAFSAELTLYLVHGWLHLAGHDDRVPARRRVMRRAEARAMILLGEHNSIPAFALKALRGQKVRAVPPNRG
jgi:probable rRNA maturation factor